MTMLILLAGLAALTPQPSEVRTFQDWSVACDNGLACEAIALLPPEEDWEQWTTLSFRRGAGANDRPVVMIQNVEQRPGALLIDGRPFPAAFSEGDDGFTVRGDEAALAAALRSAHGAEVQGADGANLGRISLAGASAAMLYMDDRQRRVGTTTALARPGRRPASAVPAPPPLPQIRIAPAPTDRPLTIDATLLDPLRRRLECDEFDTRGPEAIETVQIATGITLVLVPCGSGAYNFSSVPVIARRRGARVTTEVAPFDSQWGIAAEGHPILVNPDWDPETRRLHEYSKGRGLGDCGTRADYAWDGTRFRLVHQEEMEECRGSLYYLTTWRADITP